MPIILRQTTAQIATCPLPEKGDHRPMPERPLFPDNSKGVASTDLPEFPEHGLDSPGPLHRQRQLALPGPEPAVQRRDALGKDVQFRAGGPAAQTEARATPSPPSSSPSSLPQEASSGGQRPGNEKLEQPRGQAAPTGVQF